MSDADADPTPVDVAEAVDDTEDDETDALDAGIDTDQDTDDELQDDTDGDTDDDVAAERQIAPTAVAVMTYLARAVVEDADAVNVEVSRGRNNRVTLSVSAAPNDFGRLIGRRGRVAAALRTVVGAAAAKDGVDAEVEFVE